MSAGELAKLSYEALVAEVKIQRKHESKNFYVGPSTVDIDGAGVFASVTIPCNKVMMLYTGKIITHRKDKSFTNETSKYLVQCEKQRKYIDATDDKASGIARYINTSLDPEKINGVMSFDKDCILITSSRQIEIDEEIFVNYGR